jgi:mRNA interferase RelE/StbE
VIAKTVTYTPAALRQFEKLPAHARKAVSGKLSRFAETGAGDVKALVGVAAKRLRVGDFRVIFTETPTGIEVITVAHRRDVYRQGT